MKSIYICIPMPVSIELHQRNKAYLLQCAFEKEGYMVINPFELRDQLEKSFHHVAAREPMPEEYKREHMNNVEFCREIFLCKGWADDADCMNEVDQAIRHGLTFRFEK